MSRSHNFEIGDGVVDREADDPERMYVLDPHRGRADEVHIDAIDATVAAVNPDYPADDIVVQCVHESWLDHNVGERWEHWPPETFAERFFSFVTEWSLSPRTYDYPTSRLTMADERESSVTSRSEPTAGQTSMDDWMG